MTKAYPIDPSHKYFAVFFSTKHHVRVKKENGKEARLVCDLIPFGTDNRKKLIFDELKRRGII
jgi:hypothetical protein